MIARVTREAEAGLPGIASLVMNALLCLPTSLSRTDVGRLPGGLAVIEDQFIDLIEPLLQQAGSFQGGEEFRQPPLDVLRYYRRPAMGVFPFSGTHRAWC